MHMCSFVTVVSIAFVTSCTQSENVTTVSTKHEKQSPGEVMDDREKVPEHAAVKSLKCGICWDYFHRPHTLKCGHSFCLRCLTKLAKLTLDSNELISFSVLKFPCPTCRKSVGVKYILRHHATVNYVIQEYVAHWRKERNQVREVSRIATRSIGSQYSLDPEEDMKYEWDDELSEISATQYDYVTSRIDVSSFLSDVATSVSSASCADQSETGSNVTCDTSTDESDDLDFHIGSPRRLLHHRGFFGAFRDFYYEIIMTIHDMFRAPNRSIMALIWCGYTFSIMVIANGFFPYMALYSLLFLLILYAETIQQRRIRQ